MRKLLAAVAVIGLSTAAIAQSAGDFISVDADQDGGVTLAELQVVVPDITPELFAAADADSSGALDQAEYDALIAQMGM
jgi:hypothetical protein